MRLDRFLFDSGNADLISLAVHRRGGDNRASRERLKRVLRCAVKNELTERQRRCLLMYYYQGMKMDEIAKTLGITRSTVSRHIKRARERLYHIARYYE